MDHSTKMTIGPGLRRHLEFAETSRVNGVAGGTRGTKKISSSVKRTPRWLLFKGGGASTVWHTRGRSDLTLKGLKIRDPNRPMTDLVG